MMLELGKIQKLRIAREKDFGVYLTDEEGQESVLLPKKQLPNGLKVGDEIEVFLYNDSKDRMIATTRRPLMQVGEISRVEVMDVTEIGAFVSIGLERDVLVPHHEMRYELKKGERIEVYLYIDKSKRLAATMYTKKHEDARKMDPAAVKTFNYEKNAAEIYKIITEKFEGHLPYTDKTVESDQIMKDFGVSKAVFKRSLGKLLKENKIKITQTAIFCIY